MYPGEKFQGVQLKQSKHLASGFFFFLQDYLLTIQTTDCSVAFKTKSDVTREIFTH